MSVPTNAELEANSPDDAFDAVKGWLARHPQPAGANREQWLNWMTANFFIDPEIRGSFRKEFGISWQV